MICEEFNWLTMLEALASGKRTLSLDEFIDLKCRARHWPTCACGVLCRALPRNSLGQPDDRILYRLGITFARSVLDAQWKPALRCFHKIEARTTLLLNQMGDVPV